MYSLVVGGGAIAHADIVISRKCALQYFEKQLDGRSVVRDVEWEEDVADAHACKMQDVQEKSLLQLQDSWENSSEFLSEKCTFRLLFVPPLNFS